MSQRYVDFVMRFAHYELTPEPEARYYGEIPTFPGVQATGATMEECRGQLEEALSVWLVTDGLLPAGRPAPGGAAFDAAPRC